MGGLGTRNLLGHQRHTALGWGGAGGRYVSAPSMSSYAPVPQCPQALSRLRTGIITAALCSIMEATLLLMEDPPRCLPRCVSP